jgi:hypothetical protein
MARSNRHDCDEDDDDFFEEYEQVLKDRVKSLKKPEDAFDAKAFIALSDQLPKSKYKIYRELQKKAKDLVRDLDDVMRVFVVHELGDEYGVPEKHDDTVLCEFCDLIQSESDHWECQCEKERMTRFAEEIGCVL